MRDNMEERGRGERRQLLHCCGERHSRPGFDFPPDPRKQTYWSQPIARAGERKQRATRRLSSLHHEARCTQPPVRGGKRVAREERERRTHFPAATTRSRETAWRSTHLIRHDHRDRAEGVAQGRQDGHQGDPVLLLHRVASINNVLARSDWHRPASPPSCCCCCDAFLPNP